MALIGGSKASSSNWAQNTGLSDVSGIATALNIKGGGERSTQVVNVLDGGAIDAMRENNANSLQLFGNVLTGALDTTRTTVRDALGMSTDTLQRFSDLARSTTRDAVEGFSALAMQNSQSSDDRVLKIAGFAVAAVVAALVLPKLFGSRA